MTSTAIQHDLRALVQRFIDDVINARDLDGALVDMVAEDFVELNPLPGQGPGRKGLADVLAMLFAGFPDLHWTLHDTLVEDDRVMGYSTWTGTHQGPFMGIPATGRTATVQAWTIDRYRQDTFVESRIIMDVAALLAQLGVLPATQDA
ncbi:MAG: ester cyclase [Dermatophilaceae bacterium]